MDEELAAAPADVLRGAGLRVTAIRLAVLDAIAERPHCDAEQVRSMVVERLGSVSVQSVYDTLNTLREAQLVRRFEPAGHPARYELHVHDNHHHLACRQCAAIVDVECSERRQPCLDPIDDHGFLVDEAEVIYWGLCARCRAS